MSESVSEGLSDPIFQSPEGATYKPEEVSPEVVEKFKDQPEILKEIVDRHIAAAKYIMLLNSQYPVEGYVVVGSSADGEGLRSGKLERKPSSWVDLKTNLPSDIDMVICVEGEGEMAQRQADILARRQMMSLGYFPHAHVYTREGLERTAKDMSEWYSGARQLVEKLSETTT